MRFNFNICPPGFLLLFADVFRIFELISIRIIANARIRDAGFCDHVDHNVTLGKISDMIEFRHPRIGIALNCTMDKTVQETTLSNYEIIFTSLNDATQVSTRDAIIQCKEQTISISILALIQESLGQILIVGETIPVNLESLRFEKFNEIVDQSGFATSVQASNSNPTSSHSAIHP